MPTSTRKRKNINGPMWASAPTEYNSNKEFERGMIHMTSLFSYLITIFGGMFWLLRVIVAFTYSVGSDFPIVPIDYTTEVILLFVTILCMVFIIKRNIFGALVYFVAYGWYFGTDLYNGIMIIKDGTMETSGYISLFLSLFNTILYNSSLLKLS